MVNWKDKSILKSNIIEKVWLNKKSYKYLDFNFKCIPKKSEYWSEPIKIEVYNFDKKILEIGFYEYEDVKEKERFRFEINYFNPQTDNDCNSINHIIAVCKEYHIEQHIDMGNCHFINNQYVFRKKRNYYSFTKVWVRGKIEEDNYNEQLSYEFSTDEYVNHIKYIFKIKRIQRRTIKKNFKSYLDKLLILQKLNK